MELIQVISSEENGAERKLHLRYYKMVRSRNRTSIDEAPPTRIMALRVVIVVPIYKRENNVTS